MWFLGPHVDQGDAEPGRAIDHGPRVSRWARCEELAGLTYCWRSRSEITGLV